MNSRRLVPSVLLVLLALPGAALLADSRIERELPLGPGGRFVLDTDNGSVEVTSHSGSVARVVVTSTKDDVESLYDFDFRAGEGEVRVVVESKRKGVRSWFDWFSSPGLRFKVEVPENTAVEIGTAGGSIGLEEIRGRARLETSGGSIAASGTGGELIARTSGGSIRVEDVDGDVDVETSGGSIRIAQVRGDLHAATSGGSIDIDGVTGDIDADTSGGSIAIDHAGGAVQASTSGGSIRAGLTPGNARGGSLSTSGGGIRVALDPSVSLDVDASASGGGVVADSPIDIRGEVGKSSLRGKLGGGGALLRLRATGGKIRIEPL